VGDAGEDLAFDVGQDPAEGLAPLGGGCRKRAPQLARAETREDRELLALGQVAGDPVDETTALLAEDLQIDVAGQGTTPRP
jgi:hypothetical protein